MKKLLIIISMIVLSIVPIATVYASDEEELEDASASATVGSCDDAKATSSEPVYLSVTGATMYILGPNDYSHNLTNTSETLTGLTTGTYSMTYILQDGYQLPEGGLPKSFTVGACVTTKEDASASVTVGTCGAGDETEPVSLYVSNATMNVSGPNGYTFELAGGSANLSGLEKGSYTITYDPDDGYDDPGNLPDGFIIDLCENDGDFVELELTVKCVLDSDDDDDDDEPCPRWKVTNENDFAIEFKWSSSNSSGFSDNGTATVEASSKYTFTTRNITQKMVIEYSDKNGSKHTASLKVTRCEEDEETDEAAGGLGPSVLPFVVPTAIGISGTTFAGIMLRRKFKKNK